MTIDEVIAQNVRRLRKSAGLSVGELAERLRVNRPLAYDMERKRKGREQRHFSWEDIVRLCGALEVTVLELVLPPMDSSVEIPGGASLATGIGGHVDGTFTLFLAGGQFSALLFGSPMDGGTLDGFDVRTEERRRRTVQFRREVQELLTKFEDDFGGDS